MAKQANTNPAYLKRVSQLQPKRNLGLDMLWAFIIGGAICALGQCIEAWGLTCLHLQEEMAATLTAIVLIFLGALFTGLGIYDCLGSFAGAGSVVPITGFANSVAAPAMEFRHEGFVAGIGARLFYLAGPVLVYGMSVSVLAGVLAWWGWLG